MSVLIPVGLGELYDKISILEIKAARIRDAEKLAHVHKELSELRAIAEKFPIDQNLYLELKDVNELIWYNVGEQWELEARKNSTRRLYNWRVMHIYSMTNGPLSKKKISLQSGSTIMEVKSYASAMNQSDKVKLRVLLDFHHGMGDEIICNGLVREYCKNTRRLVFFASNAIILRFHSCTETLRICASMSSTRIRSDIGSGS